VYGAGPFLTAWINIQVSNTGIIFKIILIFYCLLAAKGGERKSLFYWEKRKAGTELTGGYLTPPNPNGLKVYFIFTSYFHI
jgi:hypothetical protein